MINCRLISLNKFDERKGEKGSLFQSRSRRCHCLSDKSMRFYRAQFSKFAVFRKIYLSFLEFSRQPFEAIDHTVNVRNSRS